MKTLSSKSKSKSKLQPTHFDDVYHTPPSLGVTTSKNKNKRKKKKKSLIHPNKLTYLVRKLKQLMKGFTPIPFKPFDLSSLSTTHENLLKRAGLWDFLHLKFDPELRSDLIAELIVCYDPQAAPHRRSFVNGRPVMLTRTEMGRALALPLRSKVAGKAEGKNLCGVEVISDEEVLFLESVVLKSVVLCGGEDGMDDDVLKVIRFIKEERRPERVDWRGLLWIMVEKELGKGVELRECYYASHLQLFLRTQKFNFFAKEVGKLGFDDLGVRKLDLGIPAADEKESEKKVEGLVGYQRRNPKIGKMIGSEGEELESDKGSGLGLGPVEDGKGVELDAAIFDENQLGVSTFGHAEGANAERLEAVNYVGNSNESMVGDLWEEGGDLVGRKSGEEVINVGLEKGEDELIMMQEGKGNELVGGCLMKGGKDGRVEVGSGSIGLITKVGKEDDCKVDPLFEVECMVNLNMRGSDEDGLILMQDGKGNEFVGDCLMKGGEDGEVEVGSESIGLITEVGKEDDSKLKMCGSDRAHAMEIENEESESLVQHSEQDTGADIKISEAGLIIEQGKDDVLGGERSGVNGDIGGKCDDQPLIELENDKDGLSSVAYGNMYLLEGECLLKESEDRGKEEWNDNVRPITGEVKEGSSKVDFSVKGGDTEMGGYDSVGAMEGKKKSGLLVQRDEEDNVADLNIEGSCNDGVKQMEKEVPECVTEHGKDDQLKLDMLVEDEGLISVDTSCSRAVGIREEDNVDLKDMDDQVKESVFQHRSPNTDTGSDSVSEKVVEISEEDSPHDIVNDCSVVEPFVSETGMMDSDFCGNESKNGVFVEPFVLEHNINANMSGSSVFESPLKTEIDLLNGGHKRLTTEGLSEKMSMTPLKRKMSHNNDIHGRMRSVGPSNNGLGDLSSWGEQIDFWLARTKMVAAEREDAWLSAQLEEQRLSKKLEQLDRTIHHLGKTKHEELQKRISKINCLENELFFMGNQIDNYKKALATTSKTFAAFRERCKLPEEPLYMDIPGSGGIVLSSTEWEKERLRREQEDTNNRLDTMITTFQLHWFDQFEGHKKRMESLGDRLSDVENEVKDMKSTFQNMLLGEGEK